jgi:phospholipid:diacylglycerol acyltransferase
MCTKGWKIDRFNPAKIPVITREMDHVPEFLDLRGGPKTAGNDREIIQRGLI